MDPRINHPALAGSIGLTQLRSGVLASQFSLDAVEMADLQQYPARLFRSLIQSFQEAAPDMGKTSSQSQWFTFLGTQAGKTIVGGITVTLKRAVKIKRNELLEASGRSSGMPIKNHVSSGLTHDPQIALSTLSVSRIKVPDRRFIHLDVAAIHDGGFDLLIHRIKPLGA
jgi:hypothetical protein